MKAAHHVKLRSFSARVRLVAISRDGTGSYRETVARGVPAQDVKVQQHRGFGFVAANFREADPILACFNDDGFALIKGILFDVRCDDPTVDAAGLLREFIETGRLDRDRYEAPSPRSYGMRSAARASF